MSIAESAAAEAALSEQRSSTSPGKRAPPRRRAIAKADEPARPEAR